MSQPSRMQMPLSTYRVTFVPHNLPLGIPMALAFNVVFYAQNGDILSFDTRSGRSSCILVKTPAERLFYSGGYLYVLHGRMLSKYTVPVNGLRFIDDDKEENERGGEERNGTLHTKIENRGSFHTARQPPLTAKKPILALQLERFPTRVVEGSNGLYFIQDTVLQILPFSENSLITIQLPLVVLDLAVDGGTCITLASTGQVFRDKDPLIARGLYLRRELRLLPTPNDSLLHSISFSSSEFRVVLSTDYRTYVFSLSGMCLGLDYSIERTGICRNGLLASDEVIAIKDAPYMVLSERLAALSYSIGSNNDHDVIIGLSASRIYFFQRLGKERDFGQAGSTTVNHSNNAYDEVLRGNYGNVTTSGRDSYDASRLFRLINGNDKEEVALSLERNTILPEELRSDKKTIRLIGEIERWKSVGKELRAIQEEQRSQFEELHLLREEVEKSLNTVRARTELIARRAKEVQKKAERTGIVGDTTQLQMKMKTLGELLEKLDSEESSGLKRQIARLRMQRAALCEILSGSKC